MLGTSSGVSSGKVNLFLEEGLAAFPEASL
jgi:hypothetical protein